MFSLCPRPLKSKHIDSICLVLVQNFQFEPKEGERSPFGQLDSITINEITRGLADLNNDTLLVAMDSRAGNSDLIARSEARFWSTESIAHVLMHSLALLPARQRRSPRTMASYGRHGLLYTQNGF
jgi:hypothetical protein